jgi:Zn ribbon nucleic-acid-binding protein/transposase-like protein
VTPEVRSQILDAFRSNDAANVVAKRVGVGRDRVYRVWKEEFGDAVRERGNRLRGLAKAQTGNAGNSAVQAKAVVAFERGEPMKGVAKRLGVHYTQVRAWWEEVYGGDVVRERGRELQTVRATENNRARARESRQIRTVEVPCEGCGEPMEVSAISASKRSRFLCTTCDLKDRGADTSCPVCGTMCVGQRGLGAHFSHAKDDEHRAWRERREQERLGEEGINHVVCMECGHRALNLWKHLKTEHRTTPSVYVAKWPGVRWRIEKVEQARLARSLEGRAANDYMKGTLKEVSCPTCGQGVRVSLFAGSLHDLRCEECKAEDDLVLWREKSEPEDFVMCRECGHRAENLTSHVRSAHTLERYCRDHPKAPLTALRAGQRLPPTNKLVLTAEQLRPFMDDKGRVIAAAASRAFRCAQWQIRRNCSDLGLKTRSRLAWQKAVLDGVASFLGVHYEPEWTDPRIVNGATGRKFHFDGYFPARNLIIEAHGEQHFYFIESWHKTHEEFERLREIDDFKVSRAREIGYTVKIVRYSDPIHDQGFWKRLLGNDVTLWANKSEEAKVRDVEEILETLRAQGFPDILPSPKTKAEFTKLRQQEVWLDGEGFVRPYTLRGTIACASFFPNRYEARYKKARSVREAWDDDDRLRAAVRVQLNAGHPTTPARVLRALQMLCRTPSVFRPAVAKYICQTYGDRGGVVWDPCAGYGGRLFGAMAAGVGTYLGTDVEPQTVEGNLRLARDLEVVDRCEIVCARAETFDPGRPLDLVFTSPPYFDLEVYGSASAEALSYGSIARWIAGFLVPVMKTARARLKLGAHLVLNLPAKPLDGVVLADEAVREASRLGFRVEPTIYMPVRRLKSGATRADPLLVFRA